MADKIPLKAIPTSGDAAAVQELESGDSVGVAHGGTSKTTIAADTFWYASALDTLSEASITTAGRAILDDANAAAQRTTLGLGTAAVENIGTSGATVPLLSTSNTYTLAQDYSAAGIYIGGSAADNLLNQYDKNLNWTPVVTVDTTGDLSIVYGVQVGRAQQVGNRVDFNLRLTMTTFTYTTATGQLHVSLPTTSEATVNNYATCACAVSEWVAPADFSVPVGSILNSSSVIDLKRQPNNGGVYGNLDISEIPSGSSPVIIHISGSYEV